MKELTKNLENRYRQIRANTIHDIYLLAVLITYIVSVPTIILSLYETSYKVFLSVLFFFVSVFFHCILIIIKKKVTNNEIRLKIYLAISLFYVLLISMISVNKYLTTSGTALFVFTVIVYLSMSKKHLTIQAIVSMALILFFSIRGVGHTIEFGLGYCFNIGGMFILLNFSLFKGIQMYQEFESIYQEQLKDIKAQNNELLTLNESYATAEEEIRVQYEELTRLNADNVYRLSHDNLTEALNWSGFAKVMEHTIKQQDYEPFRLVAFNIDNFRYINNSFGYQVGDIILKEIASQLINQKQQINYLTRTDGDTFVFTVDKNMTDEAVEKALKAVFMNIKIENVELQVKASIGIADSAKDIGITELVRNAEMVMQNVKEKDKGSLAVFEEVYYEKMQRHYKIFRMISDAVKNNEFYNVYQPKVYIDSLGIEGYEALVRWQSNELGTVYPSEFIEVAEQTGQIVEIGYVVLKNAMDFAKKAAAENEKIVISINISPKQLLDSSFMEMIKHYIDITNVSSKNIAFEITETAYIENMIQAKEVLEEIRELGISIYLDDFGTGYSSLSYLYNLPIQVLKIDKAFVDIVRNSSEAKELLKSILILSKGMHFVSIAEGVEELEQVEILKEYGCDMIQGYYFDKPLSEEDALNKVNYSYVK